MNDAAAKAAAPGDVAGRFADYLDRLPLSADDRARMLEAAAGPDPQAAFDELQSAIAEAGGESPDSVAARLRLSWSRPTKRGDVDLGRILQRDRRGRSRLITTPPVARAAMTPHIWDIDFFSRILRSLSQRRFTIGGSMSTRKEEESRGETAARPEGSERRSLIASILKRVAMLLAFTAGIAGIEYGNRAIGGPLWLGIMLFLDYVVLALWVVIGFFTEERGPSIPWRRAASRRRIFLLCFIVNQTYLATYFMTAILPFHGSHWLEKVILVIYAILFAWVGAGFWTALMGFWALIIGKDRFGINSTAPPDLVIGDDARTAILVPICNEDVPRVFAGIRATYDSLLRTGERRHFDVYFLSDTSQADTRVAELEAWLRLCREVKGFGHIFYRRRTNRIRRKSGNVADWCRRWGSLYRYMIVLDADSVMSGPCLKRLVQLMEANPNAGIIQTAPRAAGRETMYARIQQYATRVYGPLFTAGLHFWQLGESHYWGHNAILRVGPFMRHCALGRIPGRGPLAGEILSHDFVEAALMRRAGWAVWIAYDLPGSYEEMPPSLLEELKRDRRWCQGNLQNFQLFTAHGLHPAHRAVFMTGVMAYLSAPLWFLFLVLSTALLAVSVLTPINYFPEPFQLFPSWPEWHPEWALRLFTATATLLFLPKILAAVLLLVRSDELRGFGGPWRMVASVFIETLFSALLAPIRMLFHTRFVVGALLGLALVWKSPPRGDNETTWEEAFSKHGGGTLLGIVWAAGVLWLQPKFVVWLLPVVGSLMLSIPMSVWSSRVRYGRAFKRARLFLIPEESMPPRELRWLGMAMRKSGTEPPGFRDAVVDPVIHALTSAYGVPRERRPESVRAAREKLIDRAVREGPDALDDLSRNILLYDPLLLASLHQKVWTTPGANAGWFAEPVSEVGTT